MPKASHRYVIALGSNRPLSRSRGPAAILGEALRALAASGIGILAASPVLASRPLGPSRRLYANRAAVIETSASPPALLALMQQQERMLGRKRAQRWGARTLDLDIVLWSGGRWLDRALEIPHPAFRGRGFVLIPMRTIAPAWRDPVSGLTVRQLAARLARPKPIDRGKPHL